MLKKLLPLLTLVCATATWAAVDINQATEAELDGIHGIGPGLSGRILAERSKGAFKDWNDFMARVSGVGKKTASRFSADGLTVQGQTFDPAASAQTAAKPLKDTRLPTAGQQEATVPTPPRAAASAKAH